MSDPLLDLADALVAQLQTQFPKLVVGTAEFPIAVEWTESPDLDLADSKIKNPLIWVQDFGEKLDSVRGMETAEYEVLVVLQMKIPEGIAPALFRRAISGLAGRITRYLRPAEGACYLSVGDESVLCTKTERKPACDPDEWKDRRRFFTIISGTWRL